MRLKEPIQIPETVACIFYTQNVNTFFTNCFYFAKFSTAMCTYAIFCVFTQNGLYLKFNIKKDI